MNGLRSEWNLIVSTIKAHEQFKNYSLEKLMEILKSHEDKVTKDAKLISSAWLTLALAAIGVTQKKSVVDDSNSGISNDDLSKEDKALMVSNPKKSFKKNFSCFWKKYKQGNSNYEKPSVVNYKNFWNEDEKKGKKLLGDFKYDCDYCHGKSHFKKECMLHKQNEKKEKETEEAYYTKIIKELWKKSTITTKLVLMV